VSQEQEVRLPDIGDFEDVDVVELLVSPGDPVHVDDSLLVLESDKATMEIPCPVGGVLKKLAVAVGDKVSEGALLAIVEVADAEAKTPESSSSEPAAPAPETGPPPASPQVAPSPAAEPEPATRAQPQPLAAPEAESQEEAADVPTARSHASPSVRRLARELGVDLSLVPGTGRKGRVLQEDVQGYVKAMLAKGTAAGVPISGVDVVRAPDIDFEKFGETELQPLNRVRKLSAGNLHRSWVTVPHVTQFDEADITELDSFRKEQKTRAEQHGARLTFLPFVMKACARALEEFPHFNSSLDRTGENLVLKRYCHIGVAVDTEHGLVVPVIRDVDGKGLFTLAEELQELSERARIRRLRPEDLQGGSFSISSLGGIGGTFFTPIVNHPEVAILGVSRMEWKPVWSGSEFVPRLILPLSLSYDHRVIDGADAVRFTGRLAELLGDLRLLLL